MTHQQIEKLKEPETFAERPDKVEIIQTHMSVVCLAGERVYKLKKHIELPFADFSTLEKRREFCELELHLNRRLCPDIYLEVVPLVEDPDGRLRFVPDGEGKTDGGETIDYAVRMQRLPTERMLDVLLEEEDGVSRQEIRGIASRMVEFHRTARRDEAVKELGSPDKLREFAMNNFEQTRSMADDLFAATLHAALEKRTADDFEQFADLLAARADKGFAVEGHGDLHARNICMTDPPAIYDCIEFNPGFRCADVAAEHAFLVMDLRFRGHAELADVYLDAVIEKSGDAKIRRLMPMLVRYRAMIRAKVAAIAIGEREMPEKERHESATEARRYLRLAGATTVEDKAPIWILSCGLPATGKSTLARILAEAPGTAWPLFSSDAVRKNLAGAAPGARLPESYYTSEFSRRTYDALYRRAKSATGDGSVVLLDANFRSRGERAKARKAATQCGARFVIVEAIAEEATIRSRLAQRAGDPHATSDADLMVYEKLKDTFETPQEDEADHVFRIDNNDNPEATAEAVLGQLVAGR